MPLLSITTHSLTLPLFTPPLLLLQPRGRRSPFPRRRPALQCQMLLMQTAVLLLSSASMTKFLTN